MTDHSASHFLVTRRVERADLLSRLVALLEADSRVSAAWLAGSLGRGDADDLSDIDLWLAVDDAACSTMIANRRDYVAQLAQPLLVVEAPHNAPPDGGYLLVMYAGAAGPHYVDWQWCPQSTAHIPHDACVLFNLASIPVESSPEPLSLRERATRGTDLLIFFWAMVPIVAKKIARQQPWAVLALLSMLRRTLDDLRSLIRDNQTTIISYEDRRNSEPPARPDQQLAALRELIRDVADVTPQLQWLGCQSPDDVLLSIHDFLAHIAGLIESGGGTLDNPP